MLRPQLPALAPAVPAADHSPEGRKPASNAVSKHKGSRIASRTSSGDHASSGNMLVMFTCVLHISERAACWWLGGITELLCSSFRPGFASKPSPATEAFFYADAVLVWQQRRPSPLGPRAPARHLPWPVVRMQPSIPGLAALVFAHCQSGPHQAPNGSVWAARQLEARRGFSSSFLKSSTVVLELPPPPPAPAPFAAQPCQ